MFGGRPRGAIILPSSIRRLDLDSVPASTSAAISEVSAGEAGAGDRTGSIAQSYRTDSSSTIAGSGDFAAAMAGDIVAAMAGDIAAGFGLTTQATGSACRIRTRGLPAVLAVGTDSLGADRALETS